MVINDKVVFIPIPKNASWSVEDTCIEYGLDLKYSNVLWENSIKLNVKDKQKHIHSTIENILSTFGKNKDLEYVCIIRDSTDRFVSAWKFFINGMTNELSEESIKKIKNVGNEFIMNFIKNNKNDLINSYNSKSIRSKLLIKLLKELEISDELVIDSNFLKKYSIHIITFLSQYYWITNSVVKVKEFKLDNLKEFEDYVSLKLGIDFKLLHKNENKIDYCGIVKNQELIDFVNEHIDGMIKKTKSII